MTPRLVLASASPARLATLQRAGIHPEVIVSGVDESAVTAATVPELTAALAALKARAVAAAVGTGESSLIIGCDSLLELDGEPLGKPADAEAAIARWQRMRGRSGRLHTGHHLICLGPDSEPVERAAVASTTVHFADVTDAEIEAYVATAEPLAVAGAFTVDGLGGAFVTGIEGDHHNVVGISLPLLRTMLVDLDLRWTDFWVRPA